MSTISIGKLCELKYGKSLRKDKRIHGAIPVYGSNGIVDYHYESLVENETIIIGRKGSIGEVHYVNGPSWPIDTTYFIELKDEYEVDLQWFYRILSSLKLTDLNRSAAIPGLNRDDVYRIKIPLPPLDDQIRIAHLLCKVEGLIAQRKENLRQLDDLLKSVFLEMFGDPVRNEKGWDTVPFHKIGRFISGGTPSKSRDDFWSGDFPWVSPKDMKVSKIDDSADHISDEVFKETSLKRIPPNHLLIVVRGMILVHSFPVAINSVEIAINQDMKAIKPMKGINVIYLQNCLISLKRQILKLISTAGHGTRKFDSIAMQKLFIPKPPEKLQNHFTAIVEKVEGLKSRYQQSLADLEDLYGALSQKAFKGELDLSRVVITTEQTETHKNPKPLTQGFARQLIAGEILHRYHKNDMTQMKLQKLIHLSEYHARLVEIQGDYQRQAAGPYDNRLMYGLAAGLEKQQWFKTHGSGQKATYSPLGKAGNHQKYLSHWQDKIQKVDEVLNLLGKATPEQCEIVSTLYAAWNDLLIDGAQMTDKCIITEASHPDRWHEAKAAIDPTKWPMALDWMREHHLVPTGYGKQTRKLRRL